jgi:predicted Zn-dependent protease
LALLFCVTAWGQGSLEVLEEELARGLAILADEAQPVHYAAVALETRTVAQIGAVAGVMDVVGEETSRYLDVDLRVGTPALDSTHPLRGASGWREESRGPVRVPYAPDASYALRHAVWKEMDRRYRDGAEAVVLVRAEQRVKVAEEDPADDFSSSPPEQAVLQVPTLSLQADRWLPVLVEASALLDADPRVERDRVRITSRRAVHAFVDSEGGRLQHGKTEVLLYLSIGATAADGSEVRVDRRFHSRTEVGLPGGAELREVAGDMLREMGEKLEAPKQEPWSGPVLLSGEAAAVFFHEVLGHRVEGHRQKRDWEGKTFLEQVGQSILPEFLTVYDDPSLAEWEGQDLAGHYAFDDEGVRAQRTLLVDKGRFVGFLQGRSPLEGHPVSNGHGRRSPGHAPLSRMGNLVVESHDGRDRETLLKDLQVLARDQGLEHGFWVDGIEGGFTSTGRVTPNAFNVRATSAWRVFADGRPMERVQGADLVGTPLVAFSNLVASGRTAEVFNGRCGAESGWVSVSAVSPDMLFSNLEVQRKEKAQARPPLLAKPQAEDEEPAGPEALVDALERELRRAREGLSLPEAPPLYFLRGHLVEGDQVRVVASLDGLVEMDISPTYRVAVEARVGGPDRDNSGFGGWETGRMRSGLADGTNGYALRRVVWRLSDAAYKNAVEQFARKEAVFQAPPDHPGDFEMASPVVAAGADPRPALEPDALQSLALDLAGVLPRDGTLEAGKVQIVQTAGTLWVVDTEGTRVQSQGVETRIQAALQVRAPDGMLLTDQRSWALVEGMSLPSPATMKAELGAMAMALVARAQAPVLEEEYVGPLLLEGEAALEVFRSVLLGQVEGSPPVLPFETWMGEMGQGMFAAAGSQRVRMGRRVLPPGWDVVDDPGMRLDRPGGFQHDAEGTQAEAVHLVEDGIVRDLLMSRIPRKDLHGTNGHARASLGRRLEARASQVRITPRRSVSRRRLERAAFRSARSYGRDWVLVVRRFQADSARTMDDASPPVWGDADGPRTLPWPVELIRLYPDGSEQVLRPASLSAVDRWILRDIQKAGPMVEGVLFSAWDASHQPGGVFSGMPLYMEAPEVLIGEIELAPVQGDPRQIPRIPAPADLATPVPSPGE